MKCNAEGIELIKEFEGMLLHTYLDQKGIRTIGYGHTGEDVYAGLQISQAEAEAMLLHDLVKFEAGVDRLVRIKINENEFSALVSFVYNLGVGALAHSKLLYFLNANKREEASNEFSRWDECDGKPDPGLLRRRKAEQGLFLKPIAGTEL
jgi:lysozyme